MAQFNRLAVAIDLSITDRPGIAVAYDYRARRAIQKIENPRSAKTDYFERRSDINKDVRAGATRDFEAKTDAIRKERGNGEAEKGKENEKETQREPGAEGDKQKGGRRKRKLVADDLAEFWKN